jgi:hypothetical protein
MKYKNIIGSMVLSAVLVACSSVQTPELGNEGNWGEPEVYLVDGVAYSPREMEVFANQHLTLYYAVTPEAVEEGKVYVFTKETEYRGFKERYTPEEGLSAQGFCISLDGNTKVYDLTGYVTDDMRWLGKGSTTTELVGLDDDISSIKAADCVWTDLFDTDGDGDIMSIHGTNYSSLPSWINNSVDKVVVGN